MREGRLEVALGPSSLPRVRAPRGSAASSPSRGLAPPDRPPGRRPVCSPLRTETRQGTVVADHDWQGERRGLDDDEAEPLGARCAEGIGAREHVTVEALSVDPGERHTSKPASPDISTYEGSPTRMASTDFPSTQPPDGFDEQVGALLLFGVPADQQEPKDRVVGFACRELRGWQARAESLRTRSGGTRAQQETPRELR